jgi:hypothetical protein
MPPPKKDRVTVPISPDDRKALQQWCRKLQDMKEAGLTRILLHYAIKHAPDAVKAAMEEPD